MGAYFTYVSENRKKPLDHTSARIAK